MSNYIQTIKELSACIYAHTPLVVLMTSERDRAEEALRVTADDMGIDIDFYTDTDGFVELRRGEHRTKTSDPLTYIEEDIRRRKGHTYVLGDVRFLDTDNAFSRKTAGIVRMAAIRSSTIIIVTDDPIWQGLGKLGMFLKLDIPSQKERENLIVDFISHHRIKGFPKEKIAQTAVVLSGCTALQIKIVMNYALKTEGGFSYENLCKAASQKDKLFGKNEAVSQIKIDEVHVAGLEGVKEWLSKKEKIFFATKEDLDAKHLRQPKGVLMVGIPGCGKSLSAKLISEKWHLPLYRFDIGALFDKYVGESEKNLRRALDYIASVSPCIVWIDEIEKVLFSGGDNDTVKRILGGFLFWMQENKDRMFLIATANDIQRLPPEMFRKGRFDEVFFVDLPNEEERTAAIKLYVGLCLDLNLSDDDYSYLTKASEGFSYADIEAAIKSVAEEEFISSKKASFVDLVDEFSKTVSTFSKNKAYVENLRKWGEESAVSASRKGGK